MQRQALQKAHRKSPVLPLRIPQLSSVWFYSRPILSAQKGTCLSPAESHPPRLAPQPRRVQLRNNDPCKGENYNELTRQKAVGMEPYQHYAHTDAGGERMPDWLKLSHHRVEGVLHNVIWVQINVNIQPVGDRQPLPYILTFQSRKETPKKFFSLPVGPWEKRLPLGNHVRLGTKESTSQILSHMRDCMGRRTGEQKRQSGGWFCKPECDHCGAVSRAPDFRPKNRWCFQNTLLFILATGVENTLKKNQLII